MKRCHACQGPFLTRLEWDTFVQHIRNQRHLYEALERFMPDAAKMMLAAGPDDGEAFEYYVDYCEGDDE
jgi:hypothetical protein